ncbi:MAG: 2-phosphosulfolactate phosphatase [Bacillota bacterium]|nr:MAG: 2-phosphosulfolactate phosphatase [Bacillota bacterium]
MIHVDVLWTAREAEQHPFRPGEAAAVFDVLRATTTMAAALAAGAPGVVAVADPQRALSLRSTLHPAPLLGGEERMIRLPGFDLGNSPLEYTPERVRDRTVVLCTTNGTRAVAAALRRGCRQLFAGSLVNRTATARGLLRCLQPDPARHPRQPAANRQGTPASQQADGGPAITLICAGTHGRFSLDDVIGAGSVVEALQALVQEEEPEPQDTLQLSDAARAALQLWQQARHELADVLVGTHHGRLLVETGFAEDIEFACRVDAFDFAVQWQPHALALDTGAFVATHFPGN